MIFQKEENGMRRVSFIGETKTLKLSKIKT